ncbi:hypothetical protein ACQR10_04725 [Bradyrhizobium sp. HKCCYLRH2060]|uniref:hypothetical protein n=1 Tax=Bradyrhizobium sp. HKCCYLRH2060 TaxID=3420743 RepID=UPI003EBA9028
MGAVVGLGPGVIELGKLPSEVDPERSKNVQPGSQNQCRLGEGLRHQSGRKGQHHGACAKPDVVLLDMQPSPGVAGARALDWG